MSASRYGSTSADTVASTSTAQPSARSSSMRRSKRRHPSSSPSNMSSPPPQAVTPSLSARPHDSSMSPSQHSATSRPPQPEVSLARLPPDLLLRIGVFLQPLVTPHREDGGASCSSAWIDNSQDLINFSSTSRAVWDAVRSLVGRSWGTDKREDAEFLENVWIRRRLRTIVGRNVETGELEAADPAEGTEAADVPLRSSSLIRCMSGNFAPYERMDGTRIRHLYLRFSVHSTSLQTHADLLVAKLALMTRLESIAIVWKDEDNVVLTSPYSVGLLHAKVFKALSRHPTLREIYLCGIKITGMSPKSVQRTPDSGPHIPFEFGPKLTTLTLNACHDSALRLVACAPAATEVRIWRDFAAQPTIPVDEWWTDRNWTTVEHLEMVGFSGERGTRLLDHWRTALLALRINSTAPAFIPLRSLRLVEPYSLTTLRSDLLPALAHLPQLKSLTVLVWNDRRFTSEVIGQLYEALPELEELGIGIDNERLTWFQGDLREWGAQFARFANLHTLTWNYTPYSNLTYPEMRKHVYRFAVRGICAASSSLQALRWFGDDVHLVRTSSDSGNKSEWKWSDDPLFARPGLPSWATKPGEDDDAEGQGTTLGVSEADSLSTPNRQARDTTTSSDSVEAGEEKAGLVDRPEDDDASSEVDEPPRKRQKMKRTKGGAREGENVKEKEKGKGTGKARGKGREKRNAEGYSKPRKSLTELLVQAVGASASASARKDKGKGKALDQDDEDEHAGDDSGFFEAADW
ncbi:hypothetical protein JCM5296_004924 [Sporobolomyces johnsonii]